jgi:hypothetical protein
MISPDDRLLDSGSSCEEAKAVEGGVGGTVAGEAGAVRLWLGANDERLGGLSATYGDLAALVVSEVVSPRFTTGAGWNGKRIGIESRTGNYLSSRLLSYYPSLVVPTLRVTSWQLMKWWGLVKRRMGAISK